VSVESVVKNCEVSSKLRGSCTFEYDVSKPADFEEKKSLFEEDPIELSKRDVIELVSREDCWSRLEEEMGSVRLGSKRGGDRVGFDE